MIDVCFCCCTVRLVGGIDALEGRVEIMHYETGEFGTICDDEWDDHDAQVF